MSTASEVGFQGNVCESLKLGFVTVRYMQVYCAVTALVWQLMKAYTLSILTRLAATGHPIVDREIIEWANSKVSLSFSRNCIVAVFMPL